MKGSRYNLCPIQIVPGTVCSRYNLFPIQYVPDRENNFTCNLAPFFLHPRQRHTCKRRNHQRHILPCLQNLELLIRCYLISKKSTSLGKLRRKEQRRDTKLMQQSQGEYTQIRGDILYLSSPVSGYLPPVCYQRSGNDLWEIHLRLSPLAARWSDSGTSFCFQSGYYLPPSLLLDGGGGRNRYL